MTIYNNDNLADGLLRRKLKYCMMCYNSTKFVDYINLLCNGREMAEQSLRLDGRKVCNIKMVGLSQAESNKATVCALPSIHLPLTREVRCGAWRGIVRF